MNLKRVFNIIILLFLIKLSYFIFAFFIDKTPSVTYDFYINTVEKNDSHWYKYIAEHGYSTISDKRDLGYSEGPNYKQSEWAFFPFYPLTNKLLMECFGIPFSKSGIILSFIFSITAFLALYYFCVNYLKNEIQAYYTTILMMILPFHFYFSVLYTEAIFLTALMSAFISIQKKKYYLLSICLIPLCLIRPNGIILVLPLYLYYLEQNNILIQSTIDWKKLVARNTIIDSMYFLTGPISLGMYCLYQFSKTGYYLAFTIAQAGWGKKFMFPFMSFFRHGNLADQFNSIYSIVAILLAAWAWKKLPTSLNILIWLSILLPLCSGSVISMHRYISVVFPLFLFIGYYLAQSKFKHLVLITLFITQLWSYYFWLTGDYLAF